MGYQKPPIGAKLNYGHPLAKGLVGCWLFNEGSGDKVFDYSGNNIHGSVSNGIAQTTTNGWIDGPDGPAMIFSSHGVDFSDIKELAIAGCMTVLAWIKYTAAMSNNGIITRWGTDQSYGLWVVSSGKTQFCIRVAEASKVANAAVAYNDNKWHLCAGIFNGANLLINMDGGKEVVVGDATTGPIDTPAQIVRIGSYGNDFVTPYNGKISSIFVYKRALSASEISQIYAFPYCMFDRAFMVYWGAESGGPPPATFTPRITMMM